MSWLNVGQSSAQTDPQTIQTTEKGTNTIHLFIFFYPCRPFTFSCFDGRINFCGDQTLIGKQTIVKGFLGSEQDRTIKGVAPGRQFPVFDTDIGKVDMMICFDVHMPEVARGLAANSAEIITMPIMGGHPALARARAIENQVYLVHGRVQGPPATRAPRRRVAEMNRHILGCFSIIVLRCTISLLRASL